MKIIGVDNMINKILLKEDIVKAQGITDSLENPIAEYQELVSSRQLSARTKLILNSTGLSHENTIIRQIVHLIEISLYVVKNKGVFIIGEQGTGKSTPFTVFFKNYFEKTSGSLTSARLIGNANISDEQKRRESSILFEKKAVLVEEFTDESEANDQTVTGTLKNAMESKTFLKCKKIQAETETTFAFAGNSYAKIFNMKDLRNILEDIPQKYKDRGLADRIPFILPHFEVLFGDVKYVKESCEIIPTIHLNQIWEELRNLDYNKILIPEKSGINNPREIGIYNSFICGLCKIFYAEIKAPEWFICGWLEFLKFFRSILIEEKVYNPFNQNSARLIVEMLGYSTDEIDYIAFSGNRILIKFDSKGEIYKIALTGFGITENKLEYEFYQKNKSEAIAPIINCGKDYMTLVQKIYGNIPFENRIYFDNLKKYNAEKRINEMMNLIFLCLMKLRDM